MRYLLILLFTYQFLANAQTLTTTSISGGGGDGDNCVVTDTRTNLINLRNASGLVVGCHYVLTDHVQGRLVAGTTITLHASSVNEFSENVSVNTTYDNDAWQGIYDIDRALVLELQDNRNNIARGFNGNEVANFDWGNTFITNVLVDNATWNTTIGSTRTVTNCEIKEGSTLNTTTQVGGTLSRVKVYGASTLITSNANVNLTSFFVDNSSTVNLTAFTAGSTLSNYDIASSNINFSNSTSGVTLSNVYMISSTFNHTGVTTGAISGSTLEMSGASIIQHNIGAGALTINRLTVSGNSSVTHTTGTITLNDYYIEAGSQVIQQTGTTGNITLTNGRINGNSIVQNLSDYNVSAVRFSAYANSSLVLTNGAVGVGSFTGTELSNASSINISGTSTAGNTTVSTCHLSGNSNITKSNTGLLNITSCEFNSQSRCIFNSVRGLSVTRTSLSNLSTINATSTAGAGVNDNISDVSIDARATINFSATGATANSVLYTKNTGLSGSINISGTTSANTMQRCYVLNSTISMTNNTASNTLDLSVAENQGNITISGMTTTKNFAYLNAKNIANINITNPTGAGGINFLFAENGGSITVQGTATTTQYLYARNQGAINHNGGQAINITKEMVGTITTGNFNHSNLFMISPTSITLTGANANRTTYLGVVSSVPLF